MRSLTGIALSFILYSPAFARPAVAPNLPLSFEPNRGQADSKTLYLARGSGYMLSLESSGSRVLLHRGAKSAEISSRLVGSASSKPLEALDPLPGHSSYFRGEDPSKWVTGVPTFARVRQSGVYAGIDLIYYGNQSRLEYDFVVSPGSDPRAIRMRFGGVTSLRTDAAGNLVLSTPAGDITQQKPVVYQTVAGERRPVAGRFVIGPLSTVSFDLASYDHSKALIIDPVLVYASFLGGFDSDQGHGVAADAAGNLYFTGVTYSTQAGDADVLIRKISPDGTAFIYNADIGGSDDDIGNGIAVDATGAAYVGGRTASLDFPVDSNAFQSQNFGSNNGFVLKLDPTGANLVFSTYVGGSQDDRVFGLALDNQGAVYLTGEETSVDFPVSDNAFQRQNRGGADCFVVKFDTDGNPIFSTLVGGGSDDQAFGIAVDANGNSYITGQTGSDSYPQLNPPFQHSRHGGLEAFLTEVSADGSALVYSTFAGGGGDDSGSAVAVNAAGAAYVVGTTTSSDFPTTNGAYNTGYNGGASDAFVFAYAPSGQNLLFSTLIGSHGTDEGNGIALDAANNIYIAGDTDSDQYPVTQDAIQRNRAGGADVTVSVLNPAGTRLLYSTFLGGSGDDLGFAIALDPNANMYVTGVTSSFNFPVKANAVQTTPGGGDSDAFIAMIGTPGLVAPAGSVEAASVFGRGLAAHPPEKKFKANDAGSHKKRVPAQIEPRLGRPERLQ